jgi:glycosyltransferase involved in cell wall biosynthesis
LKVNALSSILNQTDQDFEWVIVNDGADPLTRELVGKIQSRCSVKYLEMEHPNEGFGLAYARNLGLQEASGDIVCYLDDDNSLYPGYIAAVKAFFRSALPSNSQVAFAMVQQSRRRNVYENGLLIRQGKAFISPATNTSLNDLVLHRQLFDSNGFAHLRHNAPSWNPEYRIFVDYEYFLRCIGCWGANSFRILESVLVEYVQSSEGIIGRSSYGDWAEELELLLEGNNYSVLEKDNYLRYSKVERLLLRAKIQSWRDQEAQRKPIAAFAAV